ncbi:MAG: DUF3795 domain-containing protein [Candidatus Marinimicrobia bacterium]|nr:DUF3795 domain-containing protein [Candidatus Neomarinimicrobiota bacterium]
MKKTTINNQHLTISRDIAPCGMNCAICMAFQREPNHCEGCQGTDENKPKSCLNCIIVNCVDLPASGFCYDCEKLPCRRMKQLDKRYRTKYNMSMLENLQMIKEKGIEYFLENENKRWQCETCGGLMDVHRGRCMICEPEK